MNDEEKIVKKEEKKKGNKSKRLLTAIVVCVLISSFGYVLASSGIVQDFFSSLNEPERNTFIASEEFLNMGMQNVIEQESIESFRNNFSGITFEQDSRGFIKINKQNRQITLLGFAVTGTVNNTFRKVTTLDFDWKWQRIIDERIKTMYNETADLFYNTTYNATIYLANNQNNNFNWSIYLTFDKFQHPKLTNVITNNLGASITNATFYYVFPMFNGNKILFNGKRYDVNFSSNIVLRNPTNFVPMIRINEDLTFLFNDIIDNNFTIKEIRIGNGSIIDHPELILGAIGITKGTGTVPDDTTVILDPIVTDYFVPTACGYPKNNWTTCANGFTSNNLKTKTLTLGASIDYANFSFNLPTDASIVAVDISLEARSCAGIC